jgi:ribonuclease HII
VIEKADSKRETSLVAGLDEVGLGSLAGPLTIAVIVFPLDMAPVEGVNDSKKLTKNKRELLAPTLIEAATFVQLGWASNEMIDQQGVAYAWQHAAQVALRGIPDVVELMVDGMRRVDYYSGTQHTYVKGDARFWQIGAASIVAKVARDLTMRELSKSWPGYCWDKNAGYGSKAHYQELKRVGLSPFHRRSFLKKLLKAGCPA